MFLLLSGLGVLVGLALIPVLIGLVLPAGFEAQARTTLNQTPQAVWDALHDHRARPMSGAMCRGVEDLPPVAGMPAWREDLGSSRVRVTTTESVAYSRLVREMADEVVPMRMRCEYTLVPAGSGCQVQVMAKGVIESGTWHVPIFRFMVHVFGGATSGQRQYLQALAKSFGETPTIE